ncbi:fibronectin type III-like domain-contianing protein, partial [Bifidobacterium pseudocatenulatum]|uniref:fibronectin type III-like domain-contianing protein n=1 Tax=Bifidobacterium pseudocatenulatum TaxID=28026 RepID=UPI00232F1EEE
VYVAPGKADVARPKHELKGFTKVFLKAGESKTVTIDLDERAFAYWSEKYNDWHVEAGEYAIEVGVSSRDIADTVAVALDGDGKTQPLTEWSMPINSLPTLLGEGGKKIAQFMVDEYAKLAK